MTNETIYLGVQHNKETGQTQTAMNGSLIELVTLLAICITQMEDDVVTAERVVDLVKDSIPAVKLAHESKKED